MRAYRIEMGFTGITRETARSAIKNLSPGWCIHEDPTLQPMKEKNGKIVMSEGSYKCLLTSPLLNDLQEFLSVAEILRKAGAFYNGSCGLHIKMEAAGIPVNKLVNLMNLVYASTDLLTKALCFDPDRRMQYARNLSDGFIERLNSSTNISMMTLEQLYYRGNENQVDWLKSKQSPFCPSRDLIVSLDPLFNEDREAQSYVEFRLFNATFNKNEIAYNILLCNLMLTHVLEEETYEPIKLVAKNGNDKYLMNQWLKSMGATSESFEGLRHFLTERLDGYLDAEKGYDNYVFHILPGQIDKSSKAFYTDADVFENDFLDEVRTIHHLMEA